MPMREMHWGKMSLSSSVLSENLTCVFAIYGTFFWIVCVNITKYPFEMSTKEIKHTLPNHEVLDN